MATMDGRITLAQESRFQLIDGAGVGHLFTLSPWCAAEPRHLVPLAERQATVRVRYEAGDDVIGHLAQRIDLLREAAR